MALSLPTDRAEEAESVHLEVIRSAIRDAVDEIGDQHAAGESSAEAAGRNAEDAVAQWAAEEVHHVTKVSAALRRCSVCGGAAAPRLPRLDAYPSPRFPCRQGWLLPAHHAYRSVNLASAAVLAPVVPMWAGRASWGDTTSSGNPVRAS